MSNINPFTGYVIGSVQAQNRIAADKDRQLRRVRNLARNSALQGDQLDLSVESPEALSEAGEKPHEEAPEQRHPHHSDAEHQEQEKDDTPDHLDLTA